MYRVMTESAGRASSVAPYDLASAAHDYPIWEGLPRRTVLLCTHPRSGSTLLGEALYFAGGLGCPLEYDCCFRHNDDSSCNLSERYAAPTDERTQLREA